MPPRSRSRWSRPGGRHGPPSGSSATARCRGSAPSSAPSGASAMTSPRTTYGPRRSSLSGAWWRWPTRSTSASWHSGAMRVAVIGTGIMGAGIAHSLAREGHEVVVWNRTAARAEAIAGDGVTVAASVAEAVSGSDAVVTVLFDTDAVLAVTGEIVDALGPDAVWIQASTVGP